MTVGYGPLARRPGPSPAVRANTLLQVAAAMGLLITDDDPHVFNGVQLHSYSPDPASGFDPCGTGSNAVKVPGGAIPLPEFGPVQIYFPETCTAWVVGPPPELSPADSDPFPDPALLDSFNAVADARARLLTRSVTQEDLNLAAENFWFTSRAVAGLGGTEEAAIENVLATGGAVPANPHLTDTHLVQLNGGSATNPVEGLALLEEQIGTTKKGGLIHAAPATVAYWSWYRLIQEPTRQGELYTLAGTPVVCGYGYIGAHPDGGSPVSATEDWAFATGPVVIWREPRITIYPGTYREALDRSNNNLTYRAERTYLITWDTALQAGVLIDRAVKP
jgi:hypothetical protein